MLETALMLFTIALQVSALSSSTIRRTPSIRSLIVYVVSSFGSVVKVTEQNKIPLFGSDVSMAEKGAVAAVGFSYYDLGVEAGKIAARVLKGENPAIIPVAKAPLTDLFVNLGAAKRMGVTIPKAVLDRATKTLK